MSMRIVKRYSNRRLYDTESSRTITQFDLARMIREGHQVQVVDSETGEDITVAVLARIMQAETSRWDDVREAKEFLHSIITFGGEKSMSILKNTVLMEPYEVPEGLQKLESGEEVPEGAGGIFRIMNHTGDDRLTWMKDSLHSIAAAKRAFVDLIKKNLVPYRVGTNGQATAEVMTEFDPSAEEVIFMPKRGIVAGG